MGVAVFHHIGEPTPDRFTHSIEQILDFEGQITFDGIYTSVFEHRHQLRNKKAILFVSGDQIGREGYCNKEQLLELQRYGHTLAWHGWSHRRVNELSNEEMVADLMKPDWIEPLYAYPHGDYDARSCQALKELGFDKAYSTIQGDPNNEYAIPRLYI